VTAPKLSDAVELAIQLTESLAAEREAGGALGRAAEVKTALKRLVGDADDAGGWELDYHDPAEAADVIKAALALQINWELSETKRKRGRPRASASERMDTRAAVRLSEAEARLLERAAEQLRRQTGQVHTASSVLRDGGIEYASRVLKGSGDED
jgi:hypothetical protein